MVVYQEMSEGVGVPRGSNGGFRQHGAALCVQTCFGTRIFTAVGLATSWHREAQTSRKVTLGPAEWQSCLPCLYVLLSLAAFFIAKQMVSALPDTMSANKSQGHTWASRKAVVPTLLACALERCQTFLGSSRWCQAEVAIFSISRSQGHTWTSRMANKPNLFANCSQTSQSLMRSNLRMV